jgi:hypothetical protein
LDRSVGQGRRVNLAQWLRIGPKLEREFDNEDADTLHDRIVTAREYVDARLYRADLVAELPASAPPGYLMVKAGDVNLYVGAGMTNPLRRIPTQALP